MKIKSCEIKNFGKLKDKTINLADGITVIRGNNESGKSTLSSFIKFVLYGYSGKKRDERSNEKLHYTPWDGSVSAGALVLEAESGELYRAERSGDGKGASAKILNSAGSECFEGYDAGEALYGIDGATFARSAFVGQMDVEAGGMKDIGAGLERLVIGTEDNSDFDKARERLKDERNLFFNKMRSTGKIFELTDKISELRAKKEAETENHKTLIASKYGAQETAKIIESNTEHLSRLYLEKENIDAYAAEEMLSKIRSAKEKCEQCEYDLNVATGKAERGGFIPDRKYLDELTRAFSEYLSASPDELMARNALSEAENNYKALAGKILHGKSDGAEASPDEVHALYSSASALFKTHKKFKNLGIVLLCFIVTIPVAVVMFVLSSKNKKKLSDFLSDNGFESFAELEKYDAAYDALCVSLESARADIAKKKAVLEEKKIECSVCEDMLREKLDMIGFVNVQSDTSAFNNEIKDRLIPKLREDVFEIERASAAYSKEKNALDALLSVSDTEKLSAMASKKQSEAPARASEIVEREIKYLEGANNLLEKKLSDYNTEIIRIEASGMAPEELEAEIESAEEELDVASLHRDALELAMSLMEKSRGDIRSNVLPKISSRASELFSRFTGGKYRSLYFDNEFELSVLEADDVQTRKIGFLSAGAIDAAYIALRIALAEVLCREKPTFIFDDSFVKADFTRLENILEVLVSLSKECQIVILTCHDREEKILGDKCKTVVLENI